MQSRIKELEKIERIEIPVEEQAIHFTFPQPQPSGRTVVEVSDLAKSYGPKQVLEEVSFTIDRGDRIALVGVNGAGKSTLIRMLSGMEPPTGGTLRLGHNVTAEYFAQDQYKVLDGDARMLDDISNTAPRVSTTDLRSLLGCFLFSGDDVFKPLGVLSGGERNRYALARILVSPATSCYWTSPPTTSTSGPRMFCLRPSPLSRNRRPGVARSLLSRSTRHHGSLKSKAATCTSIPAIMRTTCTVNRRRHRGTGPVAS